MSSSRENPRASVPRSVPIGRYQPVPPSTAEQGKRGRSDTAQHGPTPQMHLKSGRSPDRRRSRPPTQTSRTRAGRRCRRGAGLGRVAPQVRRPGHRPSATARRGRRPDPGRARPGRSRSHPCAVALRGDGRDLATAATGHPRAADLTGCLVELDACSPPPPGRTWRPSGPARGPRPDAGDPSVWADVVPVDLLLLCGIFGNVPDEDVERTARASAAIGRPGAT